MEGKMLCGKLIYYYEFSMRIKKNLLNVDLEINLY